MSNKFKLGKKAPRHDARTLQFKSYFTQLPPIPASIDWTGKVTDWGMLGNDEVGDCTCAGAGHLEMVWSSQASQLLPITSSQILSTYSAITGYDASKTDTSGNNPTDNGADLLTVLNYWRNNPVANYNINSYTQVPQTSLSDVRASIALFGGLYIGVQLPASAQDYFSNGQPWSDTNDNNIEGGHCIVLVGYTPEYFTAITWGAKQLITPAWFEKYVDEAYAIISPQWLEANGQSPSGFNLAQLQSDLKAV